MNKSRSPAGYTRKLLCLFCREKFCKKTVYSGIELICEIAKQYLIITKTCFSIVSYCFFSFGEFPKVLKDKADA